MVGELLRDIVYGLRDIPIVKNHNCQVSILSGAGTVKVQAMDLPAIYVHIKDEENENVHEYLGGMRHYAYRIDFYVCTQFSDQWLSEEEISDVQIKRLEFADVLQKEIRILFSSERFISLRHKYNFVAHYRRTHFKNVTAVFHDETNNITGSVHCHVIEFGIDGIGRNPFIAGALPPESIDIELFYAHKDNDELIGEIEWQRQEKSS